MNSKTLSKTALAMMVFILLSCMNKSISSHEEMISILKKVHKEAEVPGNQFYPEAGLTYLDSTLKRDRTAPEQARKNIYFRANFLLEMGKEDEAVQAFESLVKYDKTYTFDMIWKDLALAYLRQGERSNCISNHAAESCILPIKGMGVHNNTSGSLKAIAVYEKLLEKDPNDLESRWLLNLAYMTLGRYPKDVPKAFFIPGMEGDTTYKVKAFQDVAADLKLDVRDMAGASVTEDFDNDGYLDLVTSGWGTKDPIFYYKNKADGTFANLSDKTGLNGITGGLNMVQADYNNDGFTDILVLRGAWKGKYGKDPNSLLRNNGDGTFTDVTIEAGLLSFHPTQAATWNDFNNDGWLDIFIGNETSKQDELHPSELFINNQDGTFTEIAKKANCEILKYVKAVSSGDYDHDGWKDIFVSTMSGQRMLLKNNGKKGKDVSFTDVSVKAGISLHHGNSFPCWFWDYDNDGWMDIYACDYSFKTSLGVYEAAEKLNIPAGNLEKMLLYRNNHDGTFTNVAEKVGLNTNAFAMGSNFGDIDNDGFLDMYLGTGNPDYRSLVPNRMFKNIGGEKFADVTNSARVGHLQKGHGVSFADMDNDGDQDIHIEMGGAYPGDSYQNSFFLNPGQNNNNWICLKLEGVKSNRSAIGTQVKLTFKENGVTRSVYRDVNSGGSFGASPLRREIGIGQATVIDEIEIHWHGSGEIQVFKDVKPNQFLKITEGNNELQKVALKKIIWTLPDQLCLPTMSTVASLEVKPASKLK